MVRLTELFPLRLRAAGALLALVVPALLAGCAYRGQIDTPATLKATWFSYLDGTDIRASCAPGAPDRYRLVYNGRYTEQLRSYEATGDGQGGAILVARAMNEANLTDLRLDDPQAPWRWRRSDTRLGPAELAELEAVLAASGMFDGPPDGLMLNSWEFYWVASACRDGEFHFSAWVHPSAGWDRLEFPNFLFAHDATGVAVNPPRPIPVAEKLNAAASRRDERGTTVRFHLQVDGEGLGGITAL